jgi:hypothetical protein
MRAFSARVAESIIEKMWSDFASERESLRTAENGDFLLRFSGLRLTVRKGQHCYTFQRVAPIPGEIRTNYYYHYKKTRLGLKEEATWS